MRKIIAILAVAAACMAAATSAKAIDDQNPKGTVVIGAMGGVVPGLGASLIGDFVIVDSWWKGHFTVGGEADYRTFANGSYSGVALSARATYGLNITSRFEVHVGLVSGVGVHMWPKTDEAKASIDVDPCYGALTGVRFFFSDVFGVTAEVNASNFATLINAGVVFKF